ncbi:unnamed protein product [Effrenium voratum]|uniref:Uncharacterized protein n=1 Tax=Effrenium voratum TaxID=2562239 RepID=A0AA36NBU3_9DINO|nr:unnamed protein product [Effrenium voratum]
MRVFVGLLVPLVASQNQLNATTVCTYPRTCSTFLSDDLPCMTLEYARVRPAEEFRNLGSLEGGLRGMDGPGHRFWQ